MSKYAGTGLDPNNQNISDCTKQNLRGKECSNNKSTPFSHWNYNWNNNQNWLIHVSVLHGLVKVKSSQ